MPRDAPVIAIYVGQLMSALALEIFFQMLFLLGTENPSCRLRAIVLGVRALWAVNSVQILTTLPAKDAMFSCFGSWAADGFCSFVKVQYLSQRLHLLSIYGPTVLSLDLGALISILALKSFDQKV